MSTTRVAALPVMARPDADVRRPRGPRYHAPTTDVHVVQLRDILPPTRPVTERQQQRFAGLNVPLPPGGPRLWCAGDLALLQRPCVAVVGTRDVSVDGAARARRLARELVQAGAVVVSGLAKGVDTEALTAAIDAGGRVIAVIGTPLEKAYPAENKALQERIYREHLLISQFAPGTQVFPSNFPARNKVMAAVSDATVIIEASNSSGALHQAAECVRLPRWLFICRAVTETPGVTWPASFLEDPHTRVLTETRQVLDAIKAGLV